MAHARAAAIERICRDIGLPRGDRFTQDWAYELSEEYRTSPWLKKLLVAYGSEGYGVTEKQVIMTVLLDAMNDGIENGDDTVEFLWSDVAQILVDDRPMHVDLIAHWSLPGEPLEDAFPITARLRHL